MLKAQLTAKVISKLARMLNRGGETWPGEVALKVDVNLARELQRRFQQIILIAGTNGKTSTAKFIRETLERSGQRVIANRTGANLLNGIVASALVQLPLAPGRPPIGVFEVDEYALPEVALFFRPQSVLVLNIFRDQLDRYGEVNNILSRFQQAFSQLPETKIIYLASDPALYFAFRKLANSSLTYRIPSSLLIKKASAVLGDLVYCPVCGTKLDYRGYYLAHVGEWNCPRCHIQVPSTSFSFSKDQLQQLSHLPDYTQINLIGAYLILLTMGIKEAFFWQAVEKWQPAFGRGEVITKGSKQFQLYLGKNPASWSTALSNLRRNKRQGEVLVLGLNNSIPDGHDVSWIHDADCDPASGYQEIIIFGDRAYDMAIRLKLAGIKSGPVFTNPLEMMRYIGQSSHQSVNILANYSAMLEVRRAITGKTLI